MEHNSDIVYEGKLIAESTYPQRGQKGTELEIGGVKVDYYDAQKKVVHEVKKSNKMEEAHRWQVKYYLLVLKRYGIEGATGLLEYPKLKQRENVELSLADEERLSKAEEEIEATIAELQCPPVLNKPLCRNCSYHDFCYVEEA